MKPAGSRVASGEGVTEPGGRHFFSVLPFYRGMKHTRFYGLLQQEMNHSAYILTHIGHSKDE